MRSRIPTLELLVFVVGAGVVVAGAAVVKYDGADLLPAGQSDLFGGGEDQGGGRADGHRCQRPDEPRNATP